MFKRDQEKHLKRFLSNNQIKFNIFKLNFYHVNLIFRSSNIECIQTLMPYCIELAALTFNNIKYVFTILFQI